MAGYTLYTGGPYKQRNGNAVTASSTDVNGGSAKNVSSNENFRRSNWDSGVTDIPNVSGGINGVTAAQFQLMGSLNVLSVTTLNGLNLATLDSGDTTSLSVGQTILLGSTYVCRVVRIISSTTFTINRTDIFDASYSVSFIKGTFGVNEAENFIMKKFDGNVHGQVNTKLQSGAADYGRDKVHRIFALRTSKVTTAIRQGKWNIFTGQFTTDPSTSNDYTSMDIDGSNVPDEEAKDSTTKYGTKGELIYNHGGRAVKQQDYEAKTG